VTIDPADLRDLERMVDDARELRLLAVDDSAPDEWTVRVGCASKRVRDMFEDRWG
jgi:isochorismate hydrolase